jgi:hypothetical protein
MTHHIKKDIIEKYDSKDVSIFKMNQELVQGLVAKAGDTNSRVKSTAALTAKKILNVYHNSPTSVIPELSKPFKKESVIHPKILKARLDTMDSAICQFGLDDLRKGSGVSCKVHLFYIFEFNG